MRRRRRSRATWFPINPTTYGEGTSPGVTWFESSLTFQSNTEPGDTTLNAIPITLDETQGTNSTDLTPGTSLADIVQGQDYILQRIVGKVWMYLPFNYGEGFDPAATEIIGCIGLAVLPSSNDDNTPNIPAEEYNPLFARNAQQPWIWRRTWRLNCPNADAEGIGNGAFTAFSPKTNPYSTHEYGDIQSGGHLDSKVKRRVTREHRLYIVAAAGAIGASGSGDDPVDVWWGYDLRILGGMRRGKNNSSF